MSIVTKQKVAALIAYRDMLATRNLDQDLRLDPSALRTLKATIGEENYARIANSDSADNTISTFEALKAIDDALQAGAASTSMDVALGVVARAAPTIDNSADALKAIDDGEFRLLLPLSGTGVGPIQWPEGCKLIVSVMIKDGKLVVPKPGDNPSEAKLVRIQGPDQSGDESLGFGGNALYENSRPLHRHREPVLEDTNEGQTTSRTRATIERVCASLSTVS